MSNRVNAMQQSPELFKKFVAISLATKDASIEQGICDLVSIRTAQMNGCAFCLDMHVKQATMHGERTLRLHHIATWRESQLFSNRERAALAWTEVLTHLPPHGVPDAIYERVRGELSEKEISDLSFIIMVDNGWNRLNCGFQTTPGSADKAFGLDKAGLN